MKKQTRFRIIIMLFVCLAVYMLILNRIDELNMIGGEWGIITTTMIGYVPQLVGIFFGFIFIIKDMGSRHTSSGRLFLLTSVTGVLFASLFYELNADSIWIDEIVTSSFTITELQVIIILFFILIGFIIGLIKK